MEGAVKPVPLWVLLLAPVLLAALPILGSAKVLSDVAHLRAAVTVGRAVVLIEPTFRTDAITLGLGVALGAVVLFALSGRLPRAVTGPLAAVAVMVGLVASFEAKSAAVSYVHAAGYQRCEARDEARRAKRGYVVMAEAWAKPEACGPS
jgi:hypothetical protein